MLKYHNVNGLEGKISTNLIDMYRIDYRNLRLSSIIAGFHRSYGLRNEGISMSLEIVNNIMDDTDNIQDRCLLVWNLYTLIDEFIEEERLDEAMQLACRAEWNWTRDIILGDDMGVYHVSWIEQIWHKQAEIYHLADDRNKFLILTDKITSSRMSLFEKAEEATGETIAQDRCSYSCLELMAFEARKDDMESAVEHIKAAIKIKSSQQEDKNGQPDFMDLVTKGCSWKDLNQMFSKCVKYFYSLREQSYDNISFAYCKSCRHFKKDQECSKVHMTTMGHHCCSKYSYKILK